ncbi:MAG TPA: RDD family protein [Usitatibacter sp.]|nr:RDD family protein [Usitatibacter sp.]
MSPRAPGIGRRLASGVYELLLLLALVFLATFPFLAIVSDASHGWRRHALQLWVLAVCGVYFTWFWTRGGQTLPMKTWNLRVANADGSRLTGSRAVLRYVLALASFFAAGLGFWWALFDRDRQFLHDRLCGTAILEGPRA